MGEQFRPLPGEFTDRASAQQHFVRFEDAELNDSIRVAYSGEVATVAPELFYAQAFRALSFNHFGSNGEGIPAPEHALPAFLDLSYMWAHCVDEPNEGAKTDFAGIASEGEVLAMLAGARAAGLDVIARCTSAARDYNGQSAAADLELFAADPAGEITSNYLQLKKQNITTDETRYDLNKVVVLSLAELANYLPTEGETPRQKFTPFRRQLGRIGRLPLRRTDGVVSQATENMLIADALAYMHIFGEAVVEYVHQRPDIAIIEALRQGTDQSALPTTTPPN